MINYGSDTTQKFKNKQTSFYTYCETYSRFWFQFTKHFPISKFYFRFSVHDTTFQI